MIAVLQSRPLKEPEFTRVPSSVVNGTAGSATVSSGSLELGTITSRIGNLYFLANS